MRYDRSMSENTPIDQFRRVFKVPFMRERPEPVGAGSVVESATRSVGIKPCAPCQKRKKWLNDRFAVQGTRKPKR